MEPSEQALNEQERLSIQRRFKNNEKKEFKEEYKEVYKEEYKEENKEEYKEEFKEELKEESIRLDHPQTEVDITESHELLKKEYFRQRSDYKKLLVSYNELSTAFQTHLSINHSECLIEMIKDLKIEKEKTRNENNFYLQQLYFTLIENSRLQTNGDIEIENGLSFSSFKELVFQNLYLRQIVSDETGEKLKNSDKKVSQAYEVIYYQEKLINELKSEISNLQQLPISGFYMNSCPSKTEENLKINEAIAEDLRIQAKH